MQPELNYIRVVIWQLAMRRNESTVLPLFTPSKNSRISNSILGACILPCIHWYVMIIDRNTWWKKRVLRSTLLNLINYWHFCRIFWCHFYKYYTVPIFVGYDRHIKNCQSYSDILCFLSIISINLVRLSELRYNLSSTWMNAVYIGRHRKVNKLDRLVLLKFRNIKIKGIYCVFL